MIKKKIKYLFLGYGKKKTNLIDFLKKKGIQVKHLSRKLNNKDLKDVDLIISFGYNKILSKDILDNILRPPVNLHMSYLPYNRGSHPNFWSFILDTPKGITIHEIDEGADTGNIIFQKKFELDPNLEMYSTFEKTYNFLFQKLEDLFIERFEEILNQTYVAKKKGKILPIKKDTDLPTDILSWDINIIDCQKKFKNFEKN